MFQDSAVVDTLAVGASTPRGWIGVAVLVVFAVAGVYFATRGSRSVRSNSGSQTGGGGSDSGPDTDSGPGREE